MDLLNLMAKISLDSSEYINGLKKIGGLGVKAIGAATAAVGGFAMASVKTGMDFDKSMSQVAATMGKTVDEIQDLRDFAREMGRETAFSATEAADALNYMALAGYDSETSMQMLPNVLNLAAAGSMDLARASDMVTDTQTAFGISLERTTQMVDEMAKAASTGNTSVEQLGDAFLVVGGLAKELNGGFVTLDDGTQVAVDGLQEMEIALTAMANAGVKGSEAGTHMRNMIMKLSSPTAEGTKRLEKMGVAVFNAEGKMRSLSDIFKDLNVSLSTMSQQEKIQTISELFNARDLASAEALLDAIGEDWDDIGESILDSAGAAEKMKETQLNNLAGDLTILGSAISDAQIAISDVLTPSLREFVQFGTSGVQRLTEAFGSGGLSGAMDVFGEVLAEGLGMIFEKLPRFVEAGTRLLSSLVSGIIQNLPLLANSALQIIVFLANSIANNLPTLIPTVVSVILQIVDALAQNANLLADGAVQLMIGLAEGLINAIPVLLSAIPGIVMSLADAIINELRSGLGPVGELLFGKVDEAGQGASNKAGYWGGQIYSGFTTPGGHGGKAGGGAGRGGSGANPDDWGIVEQVDVAGNNAYNRAGYWGGQIQAAFQGFGGKSSGGSGRGGSDLADDIVSEVDEAGEAAAAEAALQGEVVRAKFLEADGKFRAAHASPGGSGRAGSGMSAEFYAAVEQAAEGAREAAIEGGGWVSEDFVTTVASGVAQKGSVVPDAATALMDSTKTAVDFAISDMGTSGELIPDNIAGGVTSGASTLYNSVNAAMEQANAEAAARAVQAQMAGQAFDNSTAGGIRGSSSTVSGAARSMTTGAISSARGATGGARSVGVSIGTGMESGILSVAKRIASAAARVVSMALEAAKARADSHSPSRVFRDEVGKMLTLGIAEGMVSKDVLNALDKSAAELTGDTVKDLETMVRAWDAVYKNYYEGLEHQNFFLELAGDTDGIIANYRKMQETLHEQKEHYLRMGVDANDSAIRDMEEQWWDYQDKIDGVYDGIAKKAEQTYDTMVDVMEHKLFLSEKQGKSPEERLAILEELMEETHKRAEALRAQGYTDDSKEIRELQKQWWGYHDDVEDINEDIAKGIKERNDKIANLMQSSADETIAVFEEIAEAAQKAYDEAFDAIMDKQKAMQDKLAGYGELYKSTTTTSGKTYVSLQDLDRQTKQLERYGEIIEELRSRGVSGNLMEDILGMGIDEGSEFGKRLLNMSEGGLNDYLASYQRKQDIAADISARYYKPEFDALNGQNVELNVAEQRNLEYSEEQVSLLRRIAETFEGSGGQTVQVVVDGQVIANATFDDLVMVGKQRGRDIVNVKEG